MDLQWFEHHQGLASWVQAAGVIISLLGAIGVAAYQNRANRKQAESLAKARTLQMFDAFGGIADFAYEQINGAAEAATDTPKLYWDAIFSHSTFETLGKSLDSFAVHELPDYESVATALRIRDAIHLGVSHLSMACSSYGNDPEEYDFNLNRIKDLVEYLQPQITELTECARRFGKVPK